VKSENRLVGHVEAVGDSAEPLGSRIRHQT
jgi:hypothetical protein